MIRFSLEDLGIPETAVVESAILELVPKIRQSGQVLLRPLTRGWEEGTGTYSNTRDGASWHTRDGIAPWETPGGDMDLTTDFGSGIGGVAAVAEETDGKDRFDVTVLVRQWLRSPGDNHGVILCLPEDLYYTQTTYFSREAKDPEQRPRLTVRFGE